MKFNKNGVEGIKKFQGDAVYSVKSAKEISKVSKKTGESEEQIELKLHLHQKGGDGFMVVTDWLPASLVYKIKDFLFSCGKQDLFDLEQVFPEMLVGASGYCIVEDQKSNPAYSTIKRYLPNGVKSETHFSEDQRAKEIEEMNKASGGFVSKEILDTMPNF